MSPLRAVREGAMEWAMAKKGKCKKATAKAEYLYGAGISADLNGTREGVGWLPGVENLP